MSQPRYRLQVGDIRAFYDVTETQIQVLAIVTTAKPTRGSRSNGTPAKDDLRAVALAEVKDDLSKYLRLAANEEIVITRHGRPAGILVGFASEDDWFDYRLEHHPEFLRRIAEARVAIQDGRDIRLRDIK